MQKDIRDTIRDLKKKSRFHLYGRLKEGFEVFNRVGNGNLL